MRSTLVILACIVTTVITAQGLDVRSGLPNWGVDTIQRHYLPLIAITATPDSIHSFEDHHHIEGDGSIGYDALGKCSRSQDQAIKHGYRCISNEATNLRYLIKTTTLDNHLATTQSMRRIPL